MISLGGYYRADTWEVTARLGIHSWAIGYQQQFKDKLMLMADLEGGLVQVRGGGWKGEGGIEREWERKRRERERERERLRAGVGEREQRWLYTLCLILDVAKHKSTVKKKFVIGTSLNEPHTCRCYKKIAVPMYISMCVRIHDTSSTCCTLAHAVHIKTCEGVSLRFAVT